MGIWGLWKRKQEKAKKTLSSGGKEEAFRFDREQHRPVIRSSICTGEQVAGFKNLHTGRFTEIMMIRNSEDMEEFMAEYGLSREEIRREW